MTDGNVTFIYHEYKKKYVRGLFFLIGYKNNFYFTYIPFLHLLLFFYFFFYYCTFFCVEKFILQNRRKKRNEYMEEKKWGVRARVFVKVKWKSLFFKECMPVVGVFSPFFYYYSLFGFLSLDQIRLDQIRSD